MSAAAEANTEGLALIILVAPWAVKQKIHPPHVANEWMPACTSEPKT